MNANNKNRRLLIWLAVLFFSPLAIAFWLYYGTGWRPVGSTNNGELITPARLLTGAAAVFDNRWSLVVVNEGECVSACLTRLNYAAQTLQSLGRLQTRTRYVLLHDGACCTVDLKTAGHSAAVVVNATSVPGVLTHFPPERRQSMIFIVDPLGNLMMRYDTALDPKGLRADLKHLLDLSQIG
jgi:hypothetical protein